MSFQSLEVVQVNANGCDTRDSYLQLKIVSVYFPLRVYHLPNKTSPDSLDFVNPCQLHSCIMCQIPFHLLFFTNVVLSPFYPLLSQLCKPLHISNLGSKCPSSWRPSWVGFFVLLLLQVYLPTKS